MIAPGDLLVAFSPADAYRRLAALERQGSWWRALQRPALVLLLIGASVGIAATGRVSIGLVATTALAWGWVVLIQMSIAILVILTARPIVSAPRALELWFAGHVPWTLWLLVLPLAVRADPLLPIETILLSMLAPMAWTMVIAAAFARTILRASAIASWLRAVAHQLLIVGGVLSFVAWSAGGWFRLVG